MRRMIRIGVVAAALAGFGAAGAYTVSPLRMTLTPTGSTATQRLTITNSEAQPITLSFRGLRNNIASDGKIETVPAASAMSIFPPQAVLAPGKSQTVQVRYTGGQSLGVGLYSVYVKQVPVAATQGQAQIKVATEFYVAVLVEPQGAQPNMQVKGTNRAADGTLTVTMENSGTGIGRMSTGAWAAQTGSSSTPVPATAFDYGDTAYILPGTTRIIRLKPEQSAKLGNVSGMSFTAATE